MHTWWNEVSFSFFFFPPEFGENDCKAAPELVTFVKYRFARHQALDFPSIGAIKSSLLLLLLVFYYSFFRRLNSRRLIDIPPLWDEAGDALYTHRQLLY